MQLTIFRNINFLQAIKALFNELNVPMNYVADEPTTAKEILKNYFKENNTFKLVDEVYFVGMVDDASFEGNKSLSADKIKSDYDGILVFGITLHQRESNLLPTRSQLAEISRAFNREFYYTPVVVVFKYRDNNTEYIAFSHTERLKYIQDWREGEKTGKVSILRDVNIQNTHRGHLEILKELEIAKSGKNTVNSFDSLYKYWQEVFSVSILNKKFYKELQNWYFWAIREVTFPNTPNRFDFETNEKHDEAVKEHKGKNVIRLLTRILFIWFIKEKGLIPDQLFDEKAISDKLIKDFTPQKPRGVFATGKQNSPYYRAILQNLFFATLNQEMGNRAFRIDGQNQNITNLMRYKAYFKDPNYFVQLMEEVVPFMNGGLFECLDKPHPTVKGKQGGDIIVYNDGFSDRDNNELVVPDYLFFDVDEDVDLSDDFGSNDKVYKNAKTRGLLEILQSYKFTITENTPIEEDVALDPELLGKVFENLLASYNPETKTTARKQTGSFYTPREIVNYMVDESLISFLKNTLKDENIQREQLEQDLIKLLSYDTANPFADNQGIQKRIIKALDQCTILDPACGSGAFPMGILQKMVHILHKVDPKNTEWKQRQIDRVNKAIENLEEIDDVRFRDQSIKELKTQINDIEDSFENNELDYGRKLYLIENCIYGVDIQSIATQISKLRFFISLIVDQKIDKTKENFGIRPLPNLETKFVAANTLIGIEKPKSQINLFDNLEIKKLEAELKKVRHKLFSSKSPTNKRKLREDDKELRNKIADLLINNGWENKTARQLASWDPYDQNESSPFFDPQWMFDISDGFDVVIGNPPYINANELKKRLGIKEYEILKSGYEAAKGTIDIYILFFEFGLKILGENGILTYISPNRFLSASYGEALRNFIFNGYSIVSISDFSSVNVFEAASTYPIVTSISRYNKSRNEILIRLFDQSFKIKKGWTNNIADLDLLPGKIWGFLLNSKIDIVKMMLVQSEPLRLSGTINATSTAKEADEYHNLINETKGKKLINTGTIDRFNTCWGGEYLTDKGEKYLSPYLDINSNKISKVRRKLYESPKIIFAKIAIRTEAFFDQNGEYASVNTNCIHSFSKNFSPKFITCWVNSTLFQFVYNCYFDGLKMAGGYLLYSAPNLKSLIIKQADITLQQLFILLHDILTIQHDSHQTILFDSIVDGLFFELYFSDHMKERGIDVLQFVDRDVLKVLQSREFEKLNDIDKEQVINQLHQTWTHPDNEVRNRIKLFAVRSPEILKPILGILV